MTAVEAPASPAQVRLRRGYALGSLSSGTFGTVPGLLLLPYLTDTLDVAAAIAGMIVFLPKAWDFFMNPIAGRISDRVADPRRRRRPFLLWGGVGMAVSFALMFSGPQGPGWLAAAWALAFFVASLGVPTDASFVLQSGVPIVSLVSGPLYLYDDADTVDKVDVDQLEPVGRLFADLVELVDPMAGSRLGLVPARLRRRLPRGHW